MCIVLLFKNYFIFSLALIVMTFSFSKMYSYITFSQVIDSGKRLFVFDVLKPANFTKNYRLKSVETPRKVLQ